MLSNLTARERVMLSRFRNNNYCEDPENDATWTFTLGESQVQMTNQEKGTLSSLVKKGIVVVSGSGDDSTVRLTPIGLEWLKDLA